MGLFSPERWAVTSVLIIHHSSFVIAPDLVQIPLLVIWAACCGGVAFFVLPGAAAFGFRSG